MNDRDRKELLSLLMRGGYCQYWFTRNYRVRCWDGSEYRTRLVAGRKYAPGIAMTEYERVRIEWPPELGLPMHVEEKMTYLTEHALHFVESIISFC